MLEIKDTAKPSGNQQVDAQRLADLNVGALLVVGFSIRGRLGGMLAVCSAAPNPEWSAELQQRLARVPPELQHADEPRPVAVVPFLLQLLKPRRRKRFGLAVPRFTVGGRISSRVAATCGSGTYMAMSRRLGSSSHKEATNMAGST